MTYVDEKGRKRRRKTGASGTPEPPSESFQVVDNGEEEPPPPDPTTTTEEKGKDMASTKGKKRGPQRTYEPPTLAGTADEAPVSRRRSSVYEPLINEIVATNKKSPKKWVIVNPAGREASSFRSALTTAAKDRAGVALETAVGDVDGSTMIYVRVK